MIQRNVINSFMMSGKHFTGTELFHKNHQKTGSDERENQLTTTDEQKSTWRQIRVYDGKGNLKKVVEPVFDYSPMKSPRKKYPEHECHASGCNVLTTKKSYCSKKCQTEVTKKRERNKRAEKKALRPKVYCAVCDAELAPRRPVYCSDSCSDIGTKIKMKEASERNKKTIKKRKKEEKNAKLRQRIRCELEKD